MDWKASLAGSLHIEKKKEEKVPLRHVRNTDLHDNWHFSDDFSSVCFKDELFSLKKADINISK